MKNKICALVCAAAIIASMPFTAAVTADAAELGEVDRFEETLPTEPPVTVPAYALVNEEEQEPEDEEAKKLAEIEAHKQLLSNVENGIEIYINGEYCCFNVPARLIGDTTYVPIRACAEAMGDYDVAWENGCAKIYGEGLYIEIVPFSQYIMVNGRYIYAPTGIELIAGTTMIPIRVLAEAFCADVQWDGTVKITTTEDIIVSGDEYYNEDDVYWLSRIINAEAGCESLEGKIGVGNVVLNRVADPTCPDTIYDVIFDFKYGIQFTPAWTGTVYNTPSDESIIAAKLVLDGASTVGDALYFASISNCWAAYNRPYYTTIGGHDFYL